MHYDTGLYSAPCEEKMAADKAVFWSTFWDELARIKNFFVKNLQSLPNQLSLLMQNSDNESLKFLNPAVAFIFPTCKNIEKYVFEADLQSVFESDIPGSAKKLKTAQLKRIYNSQRKKSTALFKILLKRILT